jgi:hypothetical protein
MTTESHIMYIDEPSISQEIRVHVSEFYFIDENYPENIYRYFINYQTMLPLVGVCRDSATIGYRWGSSIKVKEDFV